MPVQANHAVAFNEHPRTHGRLTGLRNKPQKQASEKADRSTFGSGVVIIMELSIGDEKHSLPLCVYVAAFGKSSHIYYIVSISPKLLFLFHTSTISSK